MCRVGQRHQKYADQESVAISPRLIKNDHDFDFRKFINCVIFSRILTSMTEPAIEKADVTLIRLNLDVTAVDHKACRWCLENDGRMASPDPSRLRC